MRVNETYLKDAIDLFMEMDARGAFDTEPEKPRKPICEFCNEECDGDIAFELEKNYWLCIPCLQKSVKRIPIG
jgi:hypothetical protein